jgi:glycosyltransferase involved in cell wall biosynthesis
MKDHDDLHIQFIQTDLGGVSHARNIALDKAQGEYISFIDDDDYVSQTYLEELLNNASEKRISLAKPIAFNDNNREIRKYRITNEFERCSILNKCNYNQARKFFSGPCMKLIPKSYIKDRRFDESFKNGEDTLFMYLISDCYEEISFTSNKAIYYRRYRDNSAVTIKRNFNERCKNGFRLLIEVLKIYIPNFWKYNFIFSITTAASTIHGIFKY